MKKVKYFIFAFICLFSCGLVFAENEVVIKSITPVYNTESGVIVTEEESQHKVTFNDKNQNVQYNIVIENKADYDVIVNDIVLSIPTEEFLEYELAGIEKEEKIANGETKEIAVSLETVLMEGWGRNFSDNLVAEIGFQKVNVPIDDKIEDLIKNPETRDSILILGLISITSISILLYLKNKKIASYIFVLGIVGTTIQVAYASTQFFINFGVNANFESPNIMVKAYEMVYNNNPAIMQEEPKPLYYWEYSPKIRNIYIENEIYEITDYEFKYDVSEKQDGRVIAYLTQNEEDNELLDLHLQADGIIYPNSDATIYFAYMYYLDEINNLSGIDTRFVTDMTAMFHSSGKYNSNLTIDLGERFDTSNVTSMRDMFASTGYSSTNFTLDLGEKFDTSNVTNMSEMFFETGYNNQKFNLDLGEKFDTSNVVDMKAMFNSTGYSSQNFTLDLGDKFDTSNVTIMQGMFARTGYSSQNFTLDLGDKFDTSNVIYMSRMFLYTGYNSSKFKLDCSNWNVNKVKYYEYFNANVKNKVIPPVWIN